MLQPDRTERFHLERVAEGWGTYVSISHTIVHQQTEYQTLEVVDTPRFGRMLLLDGIVMTSERDEFFYHENIVHPAAIAHPEPRQALVIGGGDGGSSEELLKHNTIERVVLAEIDAGVIGAARKYLQTVHRGAFDDPRLEVRIGDGRAFVESAQQRFDLIVLDLTDPVGPSAALYTREFYAACAAILGERGVLSLHVESPVSQPQHFNRIIRTLQAVFPIVRPYLVYIPLYGTWWGMATASRGTDPLGISGDEVRQRLAARGVADLQFYNDDTHRALFALPNFARSALAEAAEILSGESGLDEMSYLDEKLIISRR
ncbi:MAG TPA: polyamine aminopropyltransferase [Burkholderiales bacterium]|nr:polyamine aminopropyltransferase [Burkholderiales bacterium]